MKEALIAALIVFGVAAAANAANEEAVFHLHWENCGLREAGSTLRVTQGADVLFHMHADTRVVFHMHGYDEEIVVPADGELKHRFAAALAGRFPVGIHEGCGGDGDHHRTAFYLEVLPE